MATTIKVKLGVKLANQMGVVNCLVLLEVSLKFDSQLSREQCEEKKDQLFHSTHYIKTNQLSRNTET